MIKRFRYDFKSGIVADGKGNFISYAEYEALRQKLVAVTEQRDALVMEMVTLQNFCKNASFDADYEAEIGMEYGGFTDALNAIKTPATDAAIASLRAEGVEMFAAEMSAEHTKLQSGCYFDRQVLIYAKVSDMAESFARQLRESKGEVQS